MAWTLEPADTYKRCRKDYEKNRPKELSAVEVNLSTYFKDLQQGVKPPQIKRGFVHSKYSNGVFSIDQKGGGGNLAQTRLYVYPDVQNQVLWLLLIGDKRQQRKDVQTCYELVASLERLRIESNETSNTALGTGKQPTADANQEGAI